jgi:hypothetical protein
VAGVSFALKVLIHINSYMGMWRLKGTVNGNLGSTSAADRGVKAGVDCHQEIEW